MPDDAGFILTKILATVGPATSSPEMIARLIDEGARVFRINFSHGTYGDFESLRAAIREASASAGVPVGILGDLSGPKIRVGIQPVGGIELRAGACVEFRRALVDACGAPIGGMIISDDAAGQHVAFASNYTGLVDDLHPGHRVFIDDGEIRLLAVDASGRGDDRRVICRATVGGLVKDNKGVNLPDTTLNVPSMTPRDFECAAWAVEHELDFLALSFVRKADDVRLLDAHLRTLLKRERRRIPIIAKIEKPQALDDLDAIVDASDALMVARGDLGVEMDLATVPITQKRIIARSHEYGKPVIVATQMLQSMINDPTPTRAEVSDVANAIFDGADAVMLSGETAIGRYPVQTVKMMARIARITDHETGIDPGSTRRPPRKLQETRYRTAALAHGVSVVVKDLGAKLVVIWSQSGGGARYLSQNRMDVPIIAASSSPQTLRQMSILFAVTPVLMNLPADVEAFARAVDALLLERQWLSRGDPYVLVAGEPIGTPGVTNKMRISFAGDVCRL